MSKLALTRIANSCVLIEVDGHAILTDPYFTERWYLKRGEPLGLAHTGLPPLTAIVATSFAANHWDLRALKRFAHKGSTLVYVSSERMARQARALGFARAEALPWHEQRQPAPGLTVEAVPAGRALLWRNNAYLFAFAGTRLFFGGEIRDPALLRPHQADIALLPTNGLRPLIGPSLVMGPREAVAGAVTLGARVLVPVHDAHANDPLSLVFRRHGSAADAEVLAPIGLDVVRLPPGRRWVTEQE